MPGKSRRSQKKQFLRSKKRRDRLSRPALVTQPQAVTQASEPMPPPQVSKKPVAAPIATVQNPYFYAELLRIGILSAIMIAIIIVLSLIWR